MEEPKEETAETAVDGGGTEGQPKEAREPMTDERADELFEEFLLTVPESLQGALRMNMSMKRRRAVAETFMTAKKSKDYDAEVDEEFSKIEARLRSSQDEADVMDTFLRSVQIIVGKASRPGAKMTAAICTAQVLRPLDGDALETLVVGGSSGNIIQRKSLIVDVLDNAIKLIEREGELDREDAIEVMMGWLNEQRFRKKTKGKLLLRTANAIAGELQAADISPNDNPARSAALGRAFAEGDSGNFKDFLGQLLGVGNPRGNGPKETNLRDLEQLLGDASTGQEAVRRLRDLVTNNGELCKTCGDKKTCEDSPFRDTGLPSSGHCHEDLVQ